MAGNAPSERELEAAAVLAEYLGGKEESRDGVHALDGMHDFDIHLPDGRCIAVEVTTIADPKVVSFHNIMSDTDWSAPELRSDWWVALPDPDGDGPVIRIKPQRSAIVSALSMLETYEVSYLEPEVLDPWTPIPESTPAAVREAIRKLTSIGVRFVRSTGNATTMPRIWSLAHTGQPSATLPS